MKKVLTITLALVAMLALSATAQTPAKMSLGFKGGLNLANFTGDDAEGSEARTGIAGGAFAAFNLSPAVTIQPELLYTQKGSEDTEDDITVKVKMNYIEIPVLLKYTIPTAGSAKPSLFAGPALAINAGAKVSLDSAGIGIELDAANAKAIDLGAVFGGGLEVELGNASLVFDARYTMGLSNPLDDMTDVEIVEAITALELPLLRMDSQGDFTNEAWDIKNSAFSFMVGVTFPLGM